MARWFRGIVEGTTRYVYGSLFDNGDIAIIMSKDSVFEWEKSDMGEFHSYIVYKNSVCEAVGKKDINGYDIYTSDIVCVYKEKNCLGYYAIKYSEDECAFMGFPLISFLDEYKPIKLKDCNLLKINQLKPGKVGGSLAEQC